MIKITQEKLSKWVGITDQTLRNWKKGRISTDKKNLYKSLTIGYYLNAKKDNKTMINILSQSIEKIKYIIKNKCDDNIEVKEVLIKEVLMLEKIINDLNDLNNLKEIDENQNYL